MLRGDIEIMSLKAKIEAVIYASEEPVTLAQLTGLLGHEGQAELDHLESAQQALALEEEPADADVLNSEVLDEDGEAERAEALDHALHVAAAVEAAATREARHHAEADAAAMSSAEDVEPAAEAEPTAEGLPVAAAVTVSVTVSGSWCSFFAVLEPSKRAPRMPRHREKMGDKHAGGLMMKQTTHATASAMPTMAMVAVGGGQNEDVTRVQDVTSQVRV